MSVKQGCRQLPSKEGAANRGVTHGRDTWGTQHSPPAGVRVGSVAAEEVVSVPPVGDHPATGHCGRKRGG